MLRVPVICGDDGVPRLDLEALAQACAQRPKLLLLTNPSNPAGIAYDAGHHRNGHRQARAYGWDFRAVADSLYCRLVYYDAPFHHLIARPGNGR